MSSSDRTSGAVMLRYVLITVHFLLWLVIFPVSLALTGNLTLLITHCASGLALQIYLPATIVLSLRDSPSTFDSAGGEVAYVVVQLAAWLASAILAILIRITSSACGEIINNYGVVYQYHLAACDVLSAVAALSLIDAILLIVWLVMLVRFARNAPGMTPKEAYKVPAHRLISGEMGSAEAMAYQPTAHGAFDAHEAETEMGMVNAFASYQRFQASTPEAVSLPPYASKNSSPKGAPLLSHHEISENHLSPVPPSVVRHYSDRSGASSPDLTARLYDNRSKGNSPAPSDRRYDRSGANTPELPVNATYGDVRCEGGSSL